MRRDQEPPHISLPETLQQNPTINVYTPFPGAIEKGYIDGSPLEYQNGYKMQMPWIPDIDALILYQLQNKYRQSDSEKEHIVIMDAGAGNHQFAKQFQSNPSFGTKSKEWLALPEHSNVEVFVISFSDAKKREGFGKPQEIPTASDNQQIKTFAIPYSVTTSQSIDKLFAILTEDLGLNQTNLVLSAGFLMYLYPNVFEATVEGFINHLAPQGEMIHMEYHGAPVPFLSKDDPNININTYKNYVFKDKVTGEILANSATLLKKASALLHRKPSVKNIEMKELRKKIEKILSRSGFDIPNVSSTREELALSQIHEALYIAEIHGMIQDMSDEKNAILAKLLETKSQYITRLSPNHLYIFNRDHTQTRPYIPHPEKTYLNLSEIA